MKRHFGFGLVLGYVLVAAILGIGGVEAPPQVHVLGIIGAILTLSR